MVASQLSWQPGYSLSRRPVRKRIVRRANRGLLEDANGRRQFEFVVEHPTRTHGLRQTSSSSTPTDSGVSIDHALERDLTPDTSNDGVQLTVASRNTCLTATGQDSVTCQVNATGRAESPVETLHWPSGDTSLSPSSNLSDSDAIDKDQHVIQYLNEHQANTGTRLLEESNDSLLHPCEVLRRISGLEPDATQLLSPACTVRSPSTSIQSGMLYTSLTQKFRPILDRYDEEFCKIPLTTNIQMNPFRCQIKVDSESMFLVHAVMALAGHHVESTMTQDHRHAALQLLRRSLEGSKFTGLVSSMLDTIIVLFSLDETQSILGGWNTHLIGAYGLLEACGGIPSWTTSARAQGQVGLLTWWDAIISLLAREDCVFPYSYFEAVLTNHDGQQWDFFGLCGCPLSLVKVVMHLARLGAAKRKSSSMPYFAYDTNLLSELEHALESWQHISTEAAFQDEESMQQDQDRIHCSEAWRHSLLLYLYRVYHWTPGTSVPIRILYHARIILDHVFAIRDASMVPKQALLPLFFAGCELRDPSLRQKIVEFCSVWNDRTRYHLFQNTIPLLEEVWAEQEAKGFENMWWGQVVDDRHLASSDCHPVKLRLCFG